MSSKCTNCGKLSNTIKYFQRVDDEFVYKRCLFCRSTKAELRALVLKRDGRISDLVETCTYLTDSCAEWETVAINARELMENQRGQMLQMVDDHNELTTRLYAKCEDLTSRLVNTQRELNNLKREQHGQTVCDRVQHENTRLRKQITDVKNTMKASVDFETRELRAELRKLRRVVKKQRQKNKKQSMIASSMGDVQPPGYESGEEAVPPPAYDDVY